MYDILIILLRIYQTEGVSTVFGTAINYVALRLLGVSSSDPFSQKARETLWKLGGAGGCPSWGKFWLSVLGVYEWSGNHPIPPELWILPTSIPLHPGKMWCHTRAVYLPMCYFYGKRYQHPLDSLTSELREELVCIFMAIDTLQYPIPYDSIDWPLQKDTIASVDLYCESSAVLRLGNVMLNIYENLPNGYIRDIALKEVLRQIRMEDENTAFLDIGPVNKVMNMLIVWLEDGPNSVTFIKHLDRIKDFMWYTL